MNYNKLTCATPLATWTIVEDTSYKWLHGLHLHPRMRAEKGVDVQARSKKQRVVLANKVR